MTPFVISMSPLLMPSSARPHMTPFVTSMTPFLLLSSARPYTKPFRIEIMTHSMVGSLLVTNLEMECRGWGGSAAQIAKPKSGAGRVKQDSSARV